jgi:hypothetical protein
MYTMTQKAWLEFLGGIEFGPGQGTLYNIEMHLFETFLQACYWG